MQSNYRRLGEFIVETNIRNTSLSDYPLLGVSIQKQFIPSIANTIGTDMSTYKIIYKNQFAYGPVTSRNGDKMSIALLKEYNEGLISQAYVSFKIIDTHELLPEYLMMWFQRPEFDRYARFKSHGSAREIFDWQELCDTLLPVPSIEEQRKIIEEYNIIERRIELNNKLIRKQEETAQTLYKHWFVDFEFPNEEGRPYKSSGGKMIYNKELDKNIPEGWEDNLLNSFGIIVTGKTPSSENPEHFGDFMPFITPGDFKNYHKFITRVERALSKDGSSSLKTKILKKGSIIVTCIGSDMGKVVIANEECITNQQMNSIIVKNHFYSDYLYYSLSIIKEELKGIALGGSTMPMLSKSEFEIIKILKPSDNSLKKFDNILEGLNKLLLSKLVENNNLAILRELLLSRLATLK